MPDSIMQNRSNDAPLSSVKDPETLLSQEESAQAGGYQFIGRTITINRPRAELYVAWREFAALSRLMDNVAEVRSGGDGRHHWRAGSEGDQIEWESSISEEVTDRVIAWRSVEGAKVVQEGRIEFRDAPAGRGTEVAATIAYQPQGGLVSKIIARLAGGGPKLETHRILRRFKQLMEAGEIATTRMRAEAANGAPQPNPSTVRGD